MKLSNQQKIGIVAVVALVCSLGFPALAPATDLGVHMGFYIDSDAISLGFGMLTSLSQSEPRWFFNPNAEMIVGDRDMAAFNADFHYDFAGDSDLTFWAGAGPGLYVVERPFDDELDVGLNLLAGFGKQRGSTRPFVQGKIVAKDDAEASLAIGLRF